jgi:hypothetical protein
MHQHDYDMLIATTSHHLISPLISFLLVISFSLSFLFLSLLPPILSCLSMSRLSSCLSDHLCSRCSRLSSFLPSLSSSPAAGVMSLAHTHAHARTPPTAHLCLPLPFPSPAPCYCCPPLHPLSLQLPPLPRCPPTLPPVRASPCAASPCF